MKAKNGIFVLSLLGFLMAHSAFAVVLPDQAVRAAENVGGDDENQDAVSHFGPVDSIKKRNAAEVARPLFPISEASFSQESSRAPASVGSRGPAAEGPVKIQASDTGSSSKVIANKAKRAKSYQEIALIANELGFYPSTLFLTQGIPVRLYITGASPKSQCFMLDTFGVRRQIRNQKVEEVTFTPDQSGTFAFSCPMNGAKGTVVVKELELGAGVRIPASVSVSESAPELKNPPAEDKKSDIGDEDFTPEFRNN